MAVLPYLAKPARHRRRLDLRQEDAVGKGLAGRNRIQLLRRLWVAERLLRLMFRIFAGAIGLQRYHLPDMEELATVAQPFYDVELRGGESHMKVGKLIQAVTQHKARMVLSVKPFGCMPSSGVSDGIGPPCSIVIRKPFSVRLKRPETEKSAFRAVFDVFGLRLAVRLSFSQPESQIQALLASGTLCMLIFTRPNVSWILAGNF